MNYQRPDEGIFGEKIICKKKTNADRIRSMSDEELAKIIVTNPIFTWDKVEEDYEDVLNWLQSEAE